MSGFFLVHEVCDDRLRRISEFSSFSFFVDNIVDLRTPGHIKNCRNCKRNYESKEHREQSTKKVVTRSWIETVLEIRPFLVSRRYTIYSLFPCFLHAIQE